MKRTDDFYDYGWNDAIDNKPFLNKGINYRDGYRDCKEAKATGVDVKKI